MMATPNMWLEELKTPLNQTHKGGSVSFCNSNKGFILGVRRIDKNLNHAIENVLYVDSKKYSPLSVSQIYDKGNKVKFMSDKCTVTSLKNNEFILTTCRSKNMCVSNLGSCNAKNFTYLSTQDIVVELWHKKLGHVSFSLLNKLLSREMVWDMPKLKFESTNVYDACVKRKQTRSSF